MKIDARIETYEAGKPTLYITIKGNQPNCGWKTQLKRLKKAIADILAWRQYPTLCFVTFSCDLDTKQYQAIAAVIKAWPVDLSVAIDYDAEQVSRIFTFVENLYPGTIVQLTSWCTLAHAQAIAEALPPETFLRLTNLPERKPIQGLCIEELGAILGKLPVNTGLDISSGCNKLMFEHQLNALPPSRIVQLPATLTLEQWQWLGADAKSDACFMLPQHISATNATALVQHLTSSVILIIQGGTAPDVLKAVAEHIKPISSIRLHPTVSVEEAVIIASHLTYPAGFEINESVPATVHPDVIAALGVSTDKAHARLVAAHMNTSSASTDTLEHPLAFQPLTSSSSTLFQSSVAATTAAETELKQIIHSQQDKFIIDLPVNIRPCTEAILYQAFRKLKCTALQLPGDVSPNFGIMVARALPNNVALMLPAALGAGQETIIAIARSLKPGNSLYVRELTPTLCLAIPNLPPRVTLLLDLAADTLSKQDAITMIKLLRPGHILGLVVTQEQLNSTLIQQIYRKCVSYLPKGCILKVNAHTKLDFMCSLGGYLPESTALLVPKALSSEPSHTWLAKIAFRVIHILPYRKLILPPGISKAAVDYLIDHLPPTLSIELPNGLFLSAAQWDKLARPGIQVSGPLGFSEEMSQLEVQTILKRLQHPLSKSGQITPAIASSHQTAASLFIPASPKRTIPESGTVSSTEPSAKRQHTSVSIQQNQETSSMESQPYFLIGSP